MEDALGDNKLPGKTIGSFLLGRKPCQGKIQALLDLDTDNIVWQCPVCEDNGVISGWQDTPQGFS